MKMIRLCAFLAASAMLAPLASAQLSDDFNSDSSADYNITATADTAFTFAFDYSSMGIPAAPNTSDGTTLGLKLEANIVDPTGAESITLHTNQMFTGDYVVRFDAWVNANGPFPGGGGGSTEFLTGGVGSDGTTINQGGTSGSGGWFATTGEGGSSRDYRAYKDGGEQFAESGQFDAGLSSAGGGAHNASDPYYAGFGSIDVGNLPVQGANNGGPAQQTGTSGAGSFGFAWHEVVLTVDADGGTGGAASMNWSIDGLSIATLDAGVGSSFSTDGHVTIGYADVFSSVSDNAMLSFGLIDNLSVNLPTECWLILGIQSANLPIAFGPGPMDTLLVNVGLPYGIWDVTLSNYPTLPIPNDPFYDGITLYTQVIMINPTAFPGDWMRTSNGVASTIGGTSVNYGPRAGMGHFSNGPATIGGTLDTYFSIDP